MKRSLNLLLLFILSAGIFFSCKKENKDLSRFTAPPVLEETVNPLLGQEFVFENLFWYQDEFDNASLYFKNGENFFKHYRRMDVSIRLDTSAAWIPAVTTRGNMQGNCGCYFYFVSMQGALVVWPDPHNPTLIGTRVSLKVRFH